MTPLRSIKHLSDKIRVIRGQYSDYSNIFGSLSSVLSLRVAWREREKGERE